MKVTRYVTENSVYEVQEDYRLIRRVSGQYEPTPRQGEDGAWKPYETLTAGYLLLIRWPGVNADGTVPCTITSPVVAREECDLPEECEVCGTTDDHHTEEECYK